MNQTGQILYARRKSIIEQQNHETQFWKTTELCPIGWDILENIDEVKNFIYMK